jgi:isoquinoline 1-oxidoreductase subunit alpha
MVGITVNGQYRDLPVEEDTPLLWVVRDFFGLTGTKYGCGIGQCGACTVHVDGRAMCSCMLPVAEVAGREVRTIEAMAQDPIGSKVQAAWLETAVIQCGYCQSGQIMSASALLARTPKPSDEDIDTAMSGNICRCGTYPRIRAAIHRAAGT